MSRARVLLAGAVLVIAGIVVGVLWGVLAPGQQGVIARDRSGAHLFLALTGESSHIFDGIALFCLFTGVAAIWSVIILARLVRRWTATRVVLAMVGSVAATLLAAGVATIIARVRFTTVDTTVSVGTYVTARPVLTAPGAYLDFGALGQITGGSWIAFGVWPLVCGLGLSVVMVLTGREPMARRPRYLSRGTQSGEFVGDAQPVVDEPVHGGGPAPAAS